MKNVIGVRVTPKKIFYTIMEEDEQLNVTFINQEIIVPVALDTPRQLSYIRTTLFSIICEYNITRAGLRTAEGSAQQLNIFRLYIEGVIQELFSNSTVENYFAGTLSSMASRLETTSTELKKCYKAENNLFSIPNWENLHENHRESFLAALAAKELVVGGNL